MAFNNSHQDGRIQLAEIDRELQIGAAASNEICLRGRGMDALMGRVRPHLGGVQWQDFRSQSQSQLLPSAVLELGGYKAMVHTGDSILEDYGFLLREAIKSKLRAAGGGRASDAVQAVEKDWCVYGELPEVVKSSIYRELDEIDLQSPIESLLKDSDITDILVERFDRIWIESAGKFILSPLRFSTVESFQIYVENLLTQVHRVVDEAQPFADFILPDGSRGHIIMPPASSDGGTHLSIRKIRPTAFTLQELFDREMFDPELFKKLKDLVASRRNFLVSGATGSGKTTLLRAILQEIGLEQRVIIIEDTPELRLDRPGTVYLCSRPSQGHDLPAINLRDLVRQCLRMRPDRIIVGEVRGDEALDLLHAMNTGHRGCFGSLHANSARDAFFRFQGLVQMSIAKLSEDVVREMMMRNLNTIIHCGKNADGQRRILSWIENQNNQWLDCQV